MTDQPSVEQDEPEKSSPVEAAANATGGIHVDAKHDVNIGGDVVGRDKIVGEEYKATGRNIVQVGRLNIPIVPLIAALGIGLAALIFIGFGVTRLQQQFLQVQPTPTPIKMTGSFNVLVAEFGQENPNGQSQVTGRSHDLSQTVFDTLNAQRAAFTDVTIRTAIELRYGDAADTGVLVVDEATAQQAAQRVGAQMVIYGTLDRQDNFVPRFYVVPELRGDIAALNTGDFKFGDQPIQVGTSAQLGADNDLRTRYSALMYIITGLTYDSFGLVEQSLEIYKQAQDQLKGWPDKGQGKEILYFFLGQAAFYKQFKTNDPQAAETLNTEAEAAFHQALSSNPAYTRAMIGLGGVANVRIQHLSSTAEALGRPELGDMFAWYERALAQAQQGGDQYMENYATRELAGAYYLQGAAYRFAKDPTKAKASFDKANELIGPTEGYFSAANRPRDLEQAYLLHGNINKQHAETLGEQGDRSGAQTFYQAAQKFYQLCVDQATHTPDDRLVTEVIARDMCGPLLQKVQSALKAP